MIRGRGKMHLWHNACDVSYKANKRHKHVCQMTLPTARGIPVLQQAARNTYGSSALARCASPPHPAGPVFPPRYSIAQVARVDMPVCCVLPAFCIFLAAGVAILHPGFHALEYVARLLISQVEFLATCDARDCLRTAALVGTVWGCRETWLANGSCAWHGVYEGVVDMGCGVCAVQFCVDEVGMGVS